MCVSVREGMWLDVSPREPAGGARVCTGLHGFRNAPHRNQSHIDDIPHVFARVCTGLRPSHESAWACARRTGLHGFARVSKRTAPQPQPHWRYSARVSHGFARVCSSHLTWAPLCGWLGSAPHMDFWLISSICTDLHRFARINMVCAHLTWNMADRCFRISEAASFFPHALDISKNRTPSTKYLSAIVQNTTYNATSINLQNTAYDAT